jgi:hypothetical protein
MEHISKFRSLSKTRFDGLGYAHIKRGVWQFVDMDGEAQVGPQYASKDELLADMHRYATEYFGA